MRRTALKASSDKRIAQGLLRGLLDAAADAARRAQAVDAEARENHADKRNVLSHRQTQYVLTRETTILAC